MTHQVQPVQLRATPAPDASEAAPPATPAKPRGRLGRKLLLIPLGVVVLAGAAWFGWNYWTVGRFQESTDDAYVKADSTIIAPKVSGYLAEVLVADNQAVTAGQPLARIDDRDYAVALDQAKADVAAAQADIANAEAAIQQQGAAIDQARATTVVDQANLTFAQQQYDRYTALADRGNGSVQQAQQMAANIESAKATLQRDQAAVTASEKQLDVLRAQRDKANATLKHDQAVQGQAELNVSYTTITAPLAGTVGNRTLRVGQYVQAGTQLMAVVPLSETYVVANFKETQLTDVHRGQPVDISVDTFPDAAIKGHVDSLAPASGQEFALLPPDNATGNFTKIVQRIPVKVVLDRNDPLAGELRPGMSVIATIDTKQADTKQADAK
ncbi:MULTISPECIES: HlyD family secretion protein [Inquilinus]|uniref:Membrane fusion protein (Multidrug efflux system) n=1 Tax=Inquilinus ginsengisoli TaxID=363840 RepID=A0ABU1JMK0_9PROT|nr:HlyD family secretion protein [Inquilinus ginsengisoli]MDR6289832.1 membrane fusion protein (multidrug efflux system) [Inquilinus ginsengisoli]